MTAWRPITDDERPHAVALGRLLRSLRDETGMTQAQVGALASLQAGSLSALERGRRRTRRSTLERLARALVPEHRVDAILAELVEAAGPALAPESDYAGRVARRRERRVRRQLPGMIRETREALVAARRMVRVFPAGGDRHVRALEFVAKLEGDLDRLEKRLAEVKANPAPSSSGGRGPRLDPARPAWSEWQAYAWEVYGGGRGVQRASTLRPEVRARLRDLKAAADAEAEQQADDA